MKEIIIKQTNDRDLKFKGELLAEVSSNANNASSYYSGSVGICNTYQIFKTSGNNYVCVNKRFTQWVGAQNTLTAKVCKNENEVFKFFANEQTDKLDRFAKELLDDAKIDMSIKVD